MQIFEAILRIATILIALIDLFLRVGSAHKKD